MTDIEIVERAIARIEKGWFQVGGHDDGLGSTCLRLSITRNNEGDCKFISWKVWELMDSATRRRGFDAPEQFNDHPTTTRYDVLAVLYEVKAQL